MQLNPARGRKLVIRSVSTYCTFARFMQLNPARGRKLEVCRERYGAKKEQGLCSSTPRGDGNQTSTDKYTRMIDWQVYAAQPREGTETTRARPSVSRESRFMQLNPARGRKPSSPNGNRNVKAQVYAAQPREGTETCSTRYPM